MVNNLQNPKQLKNKTWRRGNQEEGLDFDYLDSIFMSGLKEEGEEMGEALFFEIVKKL